MAKLALQESVLLGSVPAWTAAAAGGDQVRPGNGGLLLVHNRDVAAKTVSVPLPGSTRFGTALPDPAGFSVAAAAVAVFGPFDDGLADTDGWVDITYSAVTSLFVVYIKPAVI